MKRALLLARKGEGRVSPNPMVGAVIVHGHKIIGEGFHSYYGGAHAEVNAINSVREEDRALLKDSILYVTLEPCSHHGKTPPCADLIVKTGIPEVVIGSMDPNPKVSGNGIKKLEEAGIKVRIGILEEECRELNHRFMKAHETGAPWITLKWAQSSDGFLAALNREGNPEPVKFSTPLSRIWVHRERAATDTILIGANTQRIDTPRLTARDWAGNSPRKYVAWGDFKPSDFIAAIRAEGAIGLIVEGGARLLESFIHEDLYDEIRVEISPLQLGKGIKAPAIPDNVRLKDSFFSRDNLIEIFRR